MHLKLYAPIKYGFEKLNLLRIVSRAEFENISSWKALENADAIYNRKSKGSRSKPTGYLARPSDKIAV